MIRRRPLLMGFGAQWLWTAAGTAGAAGAAGAGEASGRARSAAPSGPSSGVPVLSRAPLVFPRDHGAHPDTRVEWWYVTGLLRPSSEGGRSRSGSPGVSTEGIKAGVAEAAGQTQETGAASHAGRSDAQSDQPPAYGFQLTFFRIRRELERPLDSRFAPDQIMLGHIAVTDLVHHRLHHDQHLLRQGFANAFTDEADTRVRLADWSLSRSAGPQGRSRYQLAFRSQAANVALSLSLEAPLPPLLQGQQGWSQKGPQAQQASRYVSEPQLSGHGQLAVDGQTAMPVQARCWLDHEWSHAYLGSGGDDDPSRSVGWDWLGLNMLDGSAMMLFQMRRKDGSTLFSGGTWRDPSGRQQDLEGRTAFEAQAFWSSPTSLARYPVRWRIRTPQGLWRIEALFDAQEVDARRTTGFLYWEGVVRVLDEAGTLKGWGYLEMTGYAGRVPL